MRGQYQPHDMQINLAIKPGGLRQPYHIIPASAKTHSVRNGAVRLSWREIWANGCGTGEDAGPHNQIAECLRVWS